jgi:predicted phage-related endonuclease
MTMTTTSIPTTVELTGPELMAVSELAQIRRTLKDLEDRQKEIRGALLAKLDGAGATEGTADGVSVVKVVDSSRPNISPTKVQSLYPDVWAELGTVTHFRSVRPNAPSVA